MPKLPKNSTLDQAIDASARQYSSTAEDYAAYLKGEYEGNYEDRAESWEAHFENTRAEFNGLIYDLLDKGQHFADMNIAIIGPGMKPVGREIGNTAKKKVLPKANSLVVADFSANVVQEAVDQIHAKVNMKNTPVLPMLIDVTDGLSTAYRRLINDRLTQVNDEFELEAIAKEFDAMDDAALRKKFREMMVQIDYEEFTSPESAHSFYPQVFQGGGLSKDNRHRYQLSVNNGQDLPLHAVYMPMVIAGTGAAAEHTIWETYIRVTSDVDRGAKPENEQTWVEREMMIRNFYNLISRYNTMIAAKSIGDILKDNPEAAVLAVSDVSTVVYQNEIGVVPRLNLTALREKLMRAGVSMKQDNVDWEWRDEPEHHHGVNAFTFRKIPNFKQPEVVPLQIPGEVIQETGSQHTGTHDSEIDIVAPSTNLEVDGLADFDLESEGQGEPPDDQ